MMKQHGHDGRFTRLRARLTQALLREPSITLLERDAEAFAFPRESGHALAQPGEAPR